MMSFYLAGIIGAAAVGLGVWRANPRRAINQGFFVLSLGVCFLLFTLSQLNVKRPDIVFWVRLTNAAGALLPWLLWLLKETIIGASLDLKTVKRGWPWLLATGVLVWICTTYYFIPEGSSSEHELVGWGRNFYFVLLFAAYLALIVQSVVQMRKLDGIRRIELQMLVINGTTACLLGIVLGIAGNIFDIPELRRSQPIVSVVFYSITAWAVTSRKIFDAKQLFRSALGRAITVTSVATILFLGYQVVGRYEGGLVVLLVTAVGAVYATEQIHQWWVNSFGGDENNASARRRLLTVSRDKLEWGPSIENFSTVLSGWARTEHAIIFVGGEHSVPNQEVEVLSRGVEEELAKKGWVTPEKLYRELPPMEVSEVGDYLHKNELGVLVAGPGGAGNPAIVIGLPVRSDRKPFTWVEVQFLKECVTIVEGAVSRLLLAQKARDAEQLATAGLLGASLAHEIRNPLVTLKAVLHGAPTRFQEPAFQQLLLNVVPGELARIEDLLNGLMDLGRPKHPKLEICRLNEVIGSSLKLVLPKAKEKGVELVQKLSAGDDMINADQNSIRQVILNLAMNAIDAVSGNEGARVVSVSTAAELNELVLVISDNGPGLPKEAKRTLFRPFTQSSKSSGMGLGLAICAELVRSHHGTIEHQDTEGGGATFRITLPRNIEQGI
jgi:signal transduction histidine kinase